MQQKKLTILGQYGQLVVLLFEGVNEVDEPVRLLSPTSGYERLNDQDSATFFHDVAPQLMNDLTDTIHALRRHLLKEWSHNHEDPRQAGPISAAYFNFQNAVRQNEEASLSENPFYDLAKLIYRLHQQALQSNFQNSLKQIGETPDFNMPVVRPFKQIWGKAYRSDPLWRKLWHTISLVVISSKTMLALFLFVFSTFTTSRGVNELLQTPMVEALFGSLFLGQDGELPRALIAWGSGVVLSSAILDYKNRIFIGIVERGKIFKGIFLSMQRNPRWFVLAFFLTFVSIFTNYDGIVTLLSKHGDLAKQAEEIQHRVEMVLGQRALANPDNPQSLNGLLRSLENTAEAAIQTFRQIPEDEISGVASSRDPRKGPRYWAKHFIIFGGYYEGVNDIPTVFRNSTAAQQVNRILLDSGLDLTQSVEQRIKDLLALYRDHFNHTERKVLEKLNALNGLMTIKDFTPTELQRILTLEHYKVNQRIAEIIKLVEENKTVYDEVASDLNLLMGERVALLQLVDKYGKSVNASYNVAVNVDVPEISSIEALKSGIIPVATHKSLAELKGFLVEKYGLAMGGLILTAILYFAISIDLADVMFFMHHSAAVGRRDQKKLKQKIDQLDKWEKNLTHGLLNFFQQGQVTAILNWLPTASSVIIRYGLFRQANELKLILREPSDRHPLAALSIWFIGLFHMARHPHVNLINAWYDFALHIRSGQERMANRLFWSFYPGVQLGAGVPKQGFDYLEKQSLKGIEKNKVDFAQEVKSVVKQVEDPCGEVKWSVLFRQEDGDFKRLENALQKLQKSGKTDDESHHSGLFGRQGSALWKLFSFIAFRGYCLWRTLILSDFAPAVEPFPVEYKQWLRDLERNLEDSRRISEVVSYKVPLAKRIMQELPVFQAMVLLPVRSKIDSCDDDWALPYRALINYFIPIFHDLEAEAMQLLGFYKRTQEKLSLDDPWMTKSDGGYVQLMYNMSGENFSNVEKYDFLREQLKEAQETIALIFERIELQKQLIQETRECEQRFSHLTMRVRMRSYGQMGGQMGGHQQAAQLIDRIKHEMQLMLDSAEELVIPGAVPDELTLETLKQIRDRMHEVETRIDGGDGLFVDEMLSPTYVPSDLFPDEVVEDKLSSHDMPTYETMVSTTQAAGITSPVRSRPSAGRTQGGATQVAKAVPQLSKQTMNFKSEPTIVEEEVWVPPVPRAEPPKERRQERSTLETPLSSQEGPPVRRSNQVTHSWPKLKTTFKSPVLDLERLVVSHQASAARPLAQAPLAQAPLAQAPLAQAPLAQAPLAQAPLAQPNKGSTAMQTPDLAQIRRKENPRRQNKRVEHASTVEFINESGWIYRGLTEDISVTGVRVVIRGSLHGLYPGESGAFFLMGHADERGFPCKIVRVEEDTLVLKITGDLSRYSLLVMQDAFAQFNFLNAP
ncbi:type IV pilus assembly PilZ [Magnetococcus marinus MC-1]|uniref:Type IV pilus assembly PilZ n=1 Tax=Magnetococcus marinus (strain ATCC BAA-1437 / JCM 17883 / MC-1) TaxID=156889 RepID=A0L9V2_MAGMM|nr:PilZ domain-containing protein [Magnetococcus marinus]ABK44745.1 type IV pilus assembly PilZ [Magnetococcus marinus MC-1]